VLYDDTDERAGGKFASDGRDRIAIPGERWPARSQKRRQLNSKTARLARRSEVPMDAIIDKVVADVKARRVLV
jgi:hypothetical protein